MYDQQETSRKWDTYKNSYLDVVNNNDVKSVVLQLSKKYEKAYQQKNIPKRFRRFNDTSAIVGVSEGVVENSKRVLRMDAKIAKVFPKDEEEYKFAAEKVEAYFDSIINKKGKSKHIVVRNALFAWEIFSSEFHLPKGFPFDSVYFLADTNAQSSSPNAHTSARYPYEITVNTKNHYYRDWDIANGIYTMLHEYVHQYRLQNGLYNKSTPLIEEGIAQSIAAHLYFKNFERQKVIPGLLAYNSLSRSVVEKYIARGQDIGELLNVGRTQVEMSFGKPLVEIERGLKVAENMVRAHRRLTKLGVNPSIEEADILAKLRKTLGVID